MPRIPEESLDRASDLAGRLRDLAPLPPMEQDLYLRTLATNDAYLAQRLRDLLDEATDPDSLIDALRDDGPTVEALPSCIGRFQVRGVCGRGGMGIVYDAWDPRFERRVALKVVANEVSNRPLAISRLEREARSQGRLGAHPNIATLYEVVADDPVPILVMEFVDGSTLDELIDRTPLGERAALNLASQIAAALAHAHEKGVVHRDLKPANVIVSSDGTVKLLDFGISDALQSKSGEEPLALARRGDTTPLRGSLCYASPEQLHAAKTDQRTDVWSFGVVLLECITGRRAVDVRPDPGGSTWEVAVRWNALPRSLSRPLRGLLTRCLDPNPSMRPANGSALLQEVRKVNRQRKLRTVATGLGLALPVLGVALILGLAQVWPHAPARAQFKDSRFLQVLDDRDRVIWDAEFPHGVRSNGQDPNFNAPPARWISDGRWRGVLVASRTSAGPDELRLLDARTGRPIWARPLSWNRSLSARGELICSWIQQVYWPGAPDGAFMVNLWDYPWYGCAIQFYSTSGELLGEYDHPGGVGPDDLSVPNTDGRGIFLAGVNSSARFRREIVPFETSHHCGVVLRLDPPAVGGQAYPYSEGIPTERDWPGMTRARETAYVLMPPISPGLQANVVNLTVRATPEGERRIDVETTDGRMFTLDDSLRPVSCYAGVQHMAAALLRGQTSTPVLRITPTETRRIDVPILY